jgi:hypothetical protein
VSIDPRSASSEKNWRLRAELVRVEFERSLQAWASELGVECKVILTC